MISSVKEQTITLKGWLFSASLDWLGQEFTLSYAQLSLPRGLDVQQMSPVADLQLCTSIKVLRGSLATWEPSHLGDLKCPRRPRAAPVWTNSGTTALPLVRDSIRFETRMNYTSNWHQRWPVLQKSVTSTSFTIEYHRTVHQLAWLEPKSELTLLQNNVLGLASSRRKQFTWF